MIRFHTPAQRFRSDDPGNTGGGGNPPVTYTQEQVDEMTRAAVERETGGLKAKNGELLGKLGKFKGADPDTVSRILAAVGDAEEAEMLKGGNLQGVVDRRVGAMKTAHEQELATVQARAENLGRQAVRAAIAAKAAASGAPAGTVEFLQLKAEAEGWSVNEHGDVVQRVNGETVYARDGKTPFSPGDWVETVRTKYADLWPKGQGSGASGGGAPEGGKAFKDMNEAERVELYRSNPSEFKRQAAAQT